MDSARGVCHVIVEIVCGEVRIVVSDKDKLFIAFLEERPWILARLEKECSVSWLR